jgi:hypothetical protein
MSQGEQFEHRYDRTLWRWTVEDADRLAGRPVTEAEIERIRGALDNSTVGEAFGDVVFAVTGSLVVGQD